MIRLSSVFGNRPFCEMSTSAFSPGKKLSTERDFPSHSKTPLPSCVKPVQVTSAIVFFFDLGWFLCWGFELFVF